MGSLVPSQSLAAGTISTLLAGRPFRARVQHRLTGTVLASLALRMAIDSGCR